jgi:peptidyl-prolyl cis-trans isomerase B (cyclophilin B)
LNIFLLLLLEINITMKKITFFLLFLTVSLLPVTMCAQGIDKPQYQIATHRAGAYLGTFNIELFPLIAPLATTNFDSLVSVQFYDSTAFHRVVPGFVIQGGDPNSINGPISTWGQGDTSQPTVPAEFSVVRHLRGILGAARDVDTNSANSQFYICVANATFLDGQYTVYGQVTAGMDVVDTIVSSPRDANDVPLQKIEMFVTYTGVNDSVPDAPILTSPADLSQNILNTQTFLWSNVSSAVMYTIEFSTDPSFSNIALWRNAGLNSTTMPALNGSTTYYWRVKSNNGGHESIPSNVFSFTTATAAAQLIYPADLSAGIPVNPVFEWSAVPNATSYTLQVSTNSVFVVPYIIYDQSGITGTTQQVTGLNPTSVYYWRVRSANGIAQGFYSVKFSFTTGTGTGIAEHQDAEKNILIRSVYPNPARKSVTVEADVKQPGTIILSLKNNSGELVYTSSEKIAGTKYIHVFNVNKFKKGIYLLSVTMNGEEETRKIEVN